MAKDVLAEFVVRQARGILLPDGDAELLDVKDGVAYVRYKKARNEECPECIMAPGDLELFLREMFAKRAPHIKDIQLEVE